MTLRAMQLACICGERELFGGVDLEVGAGEALWVQGRNGVGKTSLLRVLCGLSPPADGAVHWCGRDIRSLREDFHRDLLYVGHASGLKDELTATENLLLGARLHGRYADAAAASHALSRIGLRRVLQRPVGRLSQGQRRRVALARLHLRPVPRLLVLDEPFAALDHDAAQDLITALSAHLGEGGIVVYTTHQTQRLQAALLHVLDLGRPRPC